MRASETSLFCCTVTRPLNLHQSSIPTLTCCMQNTEVNKRGKNLTQAFGGTKVVLEPGGRDLFWLRQCPSRHFRRPNGPLTHPPPTGPQVEQHREQQLDCADEPIRNPRGVPEQAPPPPRVFVQVTFMHINTEILLGTRDVHRWIFL